MNWRVFRADGPLRRVWRIVHCTWTRASNDNLSGLAAGSAFYAFLSIFPALTAVVSVYGLFIDPHVVEQQIASIQGVLPMEVVGLLQSWLHGMTQGEPLKFGIGLGISLVLALWSASSATGMLMVAVNICYGEEDRRGIVSYYLLAVALAVVLEVLALVALGLIAAVPETIAWLTIRQSWADSIAMVRWPILAAIAIVALDIVYHYAPYRKQPRWILMSWGAATATGLWLVTSYGFQLYVSTFGSYDRTYGPLGAVIVLLLWFYLGAYVTLIGAELNAEIGRQRAATH
jgi:membrane protein